MVGENRTPEHGLEPGDAPEGARAVDEIAAARLVLEKESLGVRHKGRDVEIARLKRTAFRQVAAEWIARQRILAAFEKTEQRPRVAPGVKGPEVLNAISGGFLPSGVHVLSGPHKISMPQVVSCGTVMRIQSA